MRRRFRIGIAFALFAVGITSASTPPVNAYTSPGEPSGYVNDFADALSAEQEARLSEQIRQHAAKTSHELAIVTVPTTADETIEQYAVTLFEAWGIGKEAQDNGVLLLLAIRDRRLRIEVGYGLESVLTDAKSARVIAEATPLLKQQKYPEAIQQMTDELLFTLDEAATGTRAPSQAVNSIPRREAGEWVLFAVFLSAIFTVILLPLLIAIFYSKKRGYWQTGNWNGFGGGFRGASSTKSDNASNASGGASSGPSAGSGDSFGGGSSGGGGASGSW